MIRILVLVTMLGSPSFKERERASRQLVRDYDSSIITRLVCHYTELHTHDQEQRSRLRRIREPRMSFGEVVPYGYWNGLVELDPQYDEGGFRVDYKYKHDYFCSFCKGLAGEDEPQWPYQCTRLLYQRAIWFGVPPSVVRAFNDYQLKRLKTEIEELAQGYP